MCLMVKAEPELIVVRASTFGGDRGGLVPANVLQPADVSLDVGPGRGERGEVLIGAPV
jgi:hypothetical protein